MSKLAALVATKVYGYRVSDGPYNTTEMYQDQAGNVWRTGMGGRFMPDIAIPDAMQVFDHFPNGIIQKATTLGETAYSVDIGEVCADNKSLCIAICLAALRAVGMTDAEIGEALK